MKWLEAALGVCLAGATGVGATSRAPSEAHPIVRARWGEEGEEEEGEGEEEGDRGRLAWAAADREAGRSVSEWREGPPAEMAASSKPHYPQRPFLHMHV